MRLPRFQLHDPKHAWTGWFLILLGVQLFIALHALARVSALAQDDTFIYFNYAKHLAAGNGFVFDPRGIPSEGVTSLLYLLMLVPWEKAGANPMTGAVLYNALACWIFANLAGWAGVRSGILNRWVAPLLPLLFLLACCYDKSIRLVTFRGLETMLGPLGILVCAMLAAKALKREQDFEGATAGFMLAAFTTYLIRPEYLAYLGVVGLLLLFRPSRIPKLFRPGLLFLGLFVLLFLWKWQVFGSLMPTAYYRKVAGVTHNGGAYVLEWLTAYWPLLTAAAAGLLLERRLWRQPFVQSLLIASVVNVLLVLRMQILVGYGFRFLILPTTVAYLLLALCLLSRLQGLKLPTGGSSVLAPIGAAAGLVVAFGLKPLPLGYPQAWNLASRAEQSFVENIYFTFAQHLTDYLPDPEAFTLSFGDAGTLPYALGCRYIDPNGLSEPEIAALFREEDSTEKAQAFADMIFGPEPDMVILPSGVGKDRSACRQARNGNPHDPFQGPIPGPYWERLRDEGFVHAATLDLHYPVDVTLRRSSPLYPVLKDALASWCDDPEHGQVARQALCIEGADFRISLPPAP